MFKIVFSWLFGLGVIADIVLIVLKCFGWLPWGWAMIFAVPFAVAIGGTLVFALIYLIIKIFVTIVMP